MIQFYADELHNRVCSTHSSHRCYCKLASDNEQFLFQQDTMDKFGTGHDWSPKSPETRLSSVCLAVEIVPLFDCKIFFFITSSSLFFMPETVCFFCDLIYTLTIVRI